ncbi:hypothetical protein [Acetobacter conturbans]|uniref:Transposase IS4-like domain-containing protein n=1 Tax=Acetobacter conturbans TaxID=1737472 RepID=A0ABX0K2D9_9PROT|nr:hypothetical protein [Acetobacter conturbans]
MSHSGVWERTCTVLATDRDNQYLMIDSSIVRAHQQAATGKGGRNQALERSRGGLTTKLHMMADALGRLLRFIIIAGYVDDITQASTLLEEQTGNA